MMKDFDDNSLMMEIQNGNRDAFAVLVERHSKYFFAIAYRFVNNRDLAEDVLQTAFLKLWAKPYKFKCDSDAGFKTWFVTCLKNLCLDNRRAAKYVRNIDDYEIADGREMTSDVIDKQREFIALENAIRKLSNNARTAINLGVISEMKYSDVAKIMNKSEGAVKVIIARAKQELKIIMSKEYGYELS